MLIACLNEHEDAQETAKWVKEAGRRAELGAGDIAGRAHGKEVVTKAELVPVNVMLAADEASHVSGATVAVTGGKPLI